MTRLLILLALDGIAFAQQTGTVTFTWDPMPAGQNWQQVRIYERFGSQAPYTYAKVAEVPGNQITATVQGVSAGKHTYIARSVDGWESDDSQATSTPPKPNPPGNLNHDLKAQ